MEVDLVLVTSGMNELELGFFLMVKEALKDYLNMRTLGNERWPDVYSHASYLVISGHQNAIFEEYKDLVNKRLDEVREKVVLSVGTQSFLQTLHEAWKDFKWSMDRIQSILRRLDKYLVLNKLDGVYKFGCNCFHEKIVAYERIRDALKEAFMNMFSRERSGEIVQREERYFLQKAHAILKKLLTPMIPWYEEHFEAPFLLQATQFYEIMSQTFPADMNATGISAYMSKVEAGLVAEEERAIFYKFKESTSSKMIEVLENVLITRHKKEIKKFFQTSGLVEMLNNKKTKKLALMYNLLNPALQCSLLILYECVSKHLLEKGKVLVRLVNDETNPITFVQNLLDLKDQYDNFLINSFSNDKIFEDIITRDFQFLLKENKSSPEYLSLFFESNLKKEFDEICEKGLETVLDKTVALLRCLSAKDAFGIDYHKRLANRLLLNESISIEKEKMANSKLKPVCGYETMTKLEVMVNDMSVSKTLMQEYLEEIRWNFNKFYFSLHGVNLSVRVLSTIYWPMKFPSEDAIANIPQPLDDAFHDFKCFYMRLQHRGRKLTLNPRLGSAELRVNCYRPPKTGKENVDTTSLSNLFTGDNLEPRENVILEVSTYQMFILLLYNDRDSLTYEDILKETKIPEKDLKHSLKALTKGAFSERILTRSSLSDDIKPLDAFKLNKFFSPQNDRVKIENIPLEEEPQPEPERQNTHNTVVDEKRDRADKIDAAIVRILKLTGTLAHEILVYECTEELRSRFLPSVQAINEQIEKLLEQKYISRLEDDSDIYTYVE